MAHLKNIVGDWKEKWKLLGDDAKEAYISNDIRKGLKAYWNLPKSVQRSLTFSAAQLTRDEDGNLPIPQTYGQIPHAGRALQIVADSTSDLIPEPTPEEQADLERRADEHRC
ncbi:hypothetical protein F2Q68_00017259 [Brassica cretica]|uniref:Uncharacterized protein n=1 Tax=Brassica cretica TaxID=69181 RepID=A0A8S9HL16_BRACR|nr:hypothetical protein F2Q68_00017259 [Brassica cretica]